ncbi:hypothetical protein CBF30_02120 [Vagococcus entomophilus]|uniref:Uncharacterized protein n=1 Tax=Vagococcus entomophilus TaxID=1160095 RepID=A0A430AIZ5_9ENTE|nr:hypothetical protein CBF30_02120 [Vagococcus entomophilus]
MELLWYAIIGVISFLFINAIYFILRRFSQYSFRYCGAIILITSLVCMLLFGVGIYNYNLRILAYFVVSAAIISGFLAGVIEWLLVSIYLEIRIHKV